MFKEFFDKSEIPAAIFDGNGALLYSNNRFETVPALRQIRSFQDFSNLELLTGESDFDLIYRNGTSSNPIVNTYNLDSGGSLVVSLQRLPSYESEGDVLLVKCQIRSLIYRENINSETEVEKELLAFVKPDGTIKFISHSIHELIGKRSALLIGTPYQDIVYQEDRGLFRANFDDVLKGSTARVQFRILKSDGKILWFDSVMKPLIDVTGEVKNSQISCRDITPQVEMHERQEENIFKERMLNEAKSQFIATASHQLNTPISVIKSNTKLIEQIWSDSDNKKIKILDRINNSVDKLVEIVNDLLLMEKVNSGRVSLHLEPYDLVELIHINNRQEYSQLEIKRDLKIDVIGMPREVAIDKSLFEHIISNLITNAFKYSSGKKEPQLILDFSNSEHVSISIVDYGIGIPKNEFDQIFNPFFRSQNAQEKGVGLGLSIVKNFVDLMNWNIKFESKLNEKTIFTLTIPG